MADKEDKKAEKERKKAEKKAAKEAKKAAKQGGEDSYDDEDEGGGKVIVIVVTIVIILIWLAIFALLIKLDVGGFGSTVLSPVLKNVPVVNKILPEDPNAESGDAEYGYSSLSEAVEQIKVLEAQIAASGSSDEEKDQQIAALQAEVNRLSQYETEQAEFEKLKEEFYEEVIFSDEAPDISEYQKYYESIDEENAAELYKQVF